LPGWGSSLRAVLRWPIGAHGHSALTG
jgi:hypothetical protein